jgi:hypothetical protein
MNTFTKFIISIVLVSLAVGALAAFPGGVVSAQGLFDPADPPRPAGETVTPGQAVRPGWRHAALEKLFARQQEWLAGQQERLDKQEQINARVNEWIARARQHGLDPAPLEAALAQFNASIEEARSHHNTAREILAAHAGFDEHGKVGDGPAAWETVRSAGEALRSARRIMIEAARDLLAAMREFKQANRPVKVEPNI